ncbi:MAG TPA: glycerol-3-phosphate 1-O-acyltransferase PlsY [Candidatus Hydrogenedentes bacterium]|nr:glycerol-3-phosphate 1-O-acyltransferase PlsY [Candidatus Hydrogenedentota bacterium]HOH52287.1 glycerol-3-phosphate 1-O-acyltransferase PlsY [Candidatus Hydrogenedentota bacterium]
MSPPFVSVAVILSYVLGSVPTGLWLGLKLRGVDIRQHGSKNIGATNTFRVLGKGLGIATLAGDILKGWVPVVLFAQLDTWEYLPVLCGLAAILGHTFSLFLWFRGGKGVATSTGVFLGLAPVPTLIAGGVFAIVFAATRMVSAGSISAAAAMIAAVFVIATPVPVRIVTVLVAVLVIVKHHANIRRILKGEESRL